VAHSPPDRDDNVINHTMHLDDYKKDEKGSVFSTSVGTPLDAANVRRSFRCITKAAGLGTNWTPRELRHSFVSIMSHA
jgi:site-specific recombinase XerC